MTEPYITLLSLFVIWAAIYVASLFLPLKNYGLEVTPIYILYKTKRFNDFLQRIAETNQRFWRTFANIGVVVGIVEMSIAIYFLAANLQRFLYTPKEAEPIIPVLPGITIGFRLFPYILIAFGLAVTTHETAHGILAFLEKIPVKSSGLILAPIIFGGFVEPDEEVFDKSPLFSKLRVLAVGSMTNMVTGVLLLLLLMSLFIPFSGVLVMTVPEDGPAYTAGMRSWDVIYRVNGYSTLNLSEFSRFMVAVGPGVPLKVETSNGIRNLITTAATENGSRGILGVRELQTYHAMRLGEINSQFSYHLYMTLNWASLLMINVAIFNMLPLFPFDGEAYIYSLLREKLKKGFNESRVAINLLSLFLLASNIGLTFIRYGLTPLY